MDKNIISTDRFTFVTKACATLSLISYRFALKAGVSLRNLDFRQLEIEILEGS